MSDKRIIDLEAKQTLGSGDYLAADSAQGTYKVDANTNIMTPLANVRNNVANSSASPDKYSSSTAYKVGDMVIQNDILYKCTTACSAASWAVNSACFTATTLASVVTQLNSELTNFPRIVLGSYNHSEGRATFTFDSKENKGYMALVGVSLLAIHVQTATKCSVTIYRNNGQIEYASNVTGSNYTFTISGFADASYAPFAICI